MESPFFQAEAIKGGPNPPCGTGGSPARAQAYYQDTIQANLATLVGKLDQVIERGTTLNTDSTQQMASPPGGAGPAG